MRSLPDVMNGGGGGGSGNGGWWLVVVMVEAVGIELVVVEGKNNSIVDAALEKAMPKQGLGTVTVVTEQLSGRVKNGVPSSGGRRRESV